MLKLFCADAAAGRTVGAVDGADRHRRIERQLPLAVGVHQVELDGVEIRTLRNIDLLVPGDVGIGLGIPGLQLVIDRAAAVVHDDVRQNRRLGPRPLLLIRHRLRLRCHFVLPVMRL